MKDNAEFTTGRAVFDKIANFYSTLRIKVYTAMTSGKIKPLKDDAPPKDQWAPAVTHYMQYMLQEVGALTNYSITEEIYSHTQYLAEFSTGFLKLVFDAVTVPSALISGVTGFISGVGDSLRGSWDDRTRTYSVALLGQCHEAVQENTDPDKPIYRYFPKLKYYYITVAASQSEFSSSCATTRQITFNFSYEYYVTSVAAAGYTLVTDLVGDSPLDDAPPPHPFATLVGGDTAVVAVPGPWPEATCCSGTSVYCSASGAPSAWNEGRPVSAAVTIGAPGFWPIRFQSGGRRSSASSIISPRMRRT